jgi:hypothetical protein
MAKIASQCAIFCHFFRLRRKYKIVKYRIFRAFLGANFHRKLASFALGSPNCAQLSSQPTPAQMVKNIARFSAFWLRATRRPSSFLPFLDGVDPLRAFPTLAIYE